MLSYSSDHVGRKLSPIDSRKTLIEGGEDVAIRARDLKAGAIEEKLLHPLTTMFGTSLLRQPYPTGSAMTSNRIPAGSSALRRRLRALRQQH
jgi:hypothetical protein